VPRIPRQVPQPPAGEFMHSKSQPSAHRAYWHANLRLVAFCLSVWFLCSYGFGILLVEPLNTIRLGGFKLGFWFAQQGSIYIFVALIFFYAWRMNRLDHKFDVDED
jgi:putative solute:sodium symporter small subunit